MVNFFLTTENGERSEGFFVKQKVGMGEGKSFKDFVLLSAWCLVFGVFRVFGGSSESTPLAKIGRFLGKRLKKGRGWDKSGSLPYLCHGGGR